jgi:hypothetical protein
VVRDKRRVGGGGQPGLQHVEQYRA